MAAAKEVVVVAVVAVDHSAVVPPSVEVAVLPSHMVVVVADRPVVAGVVAVEDSALEAQNSPLVEEVPLMEAPVEAHPQVAVQVAPAVQAAVESPEALKVVHLAAQAHSARLDRLAVAQAALEVVV